MRYYHGTAASNYESILRNGLKAGADKIWNCSQHGVYLWPHDVRYTDCTLTEKASGFYSALFSSTPSLITKKEGKCIIVEVEIDDKLTVEDKSCPNPGPTRFFPGDISPEKITRIEESSDFSFWIPLLASGWLIYNQLFKNGISRANKEFASIISNEFWKGHTHGQPYSNVLVQAMDWEVLYKNEFAKEMELV